MSSTDEHNEATASAAAMSACREAMDPPRVAPQLFASPFLPEHERAIVTILHIIHPSLKISRAALMILQRFSDRLAHYLIHRACFGLNSGMHSRLEALSSRVQPSSAIAAPSAAAAAPPSAPVAPAVPGDPHSIHFAFDDPVISSLNDLCRHAHAEAAKARLKLCHARQNGVEAPTTRDCGLELPLVLADRWLQDFTLGLRLADDDAVLPPLLFSTEQEVVLCANVEYILAELLELSGNVARDNRAPSIQPSHLFLAVERDAELRAFCAFLPVDWRIESHGVESPLQLARASQPLDATRHSLRFLESVFAPQAAAQAELNRSSWYQDSAAVIEAARMAARGQLTESSLGRQLRNAHVRPLRFWGVDKAKRLP